ncbi:MAG TPA: ATP-binding protein, partial [Candidatus Limnocylindria bacterium]|nr:ATP-binding protein [Candidatus Limnocylindria bacterium]
LLRPVLMGTRPPVGARDLTIRTRYIIASAGAAFATAGTLLSVVIDFESTPDAVLRGFLVLGVALVLFAGVIGALVGNDGASAVEAVTRRVRELAAAPGDSEMPVVTADEMADLALATNELEARIRHDEAEAAARMERERVARELHDGVAKSVSVLALEAATGAARASDDLRPLLARIQRLARLLSDELRAIVTDVRALDEALPYAQVLRAVAERHAPVDFAVDGDVERMGTLARFEVLRIVDEALTNAVRHAAAKRVVARITVSADRVEVDVEDDGVGVGEVEWKELPRSGRFGLVGIRERASLLGGAVRVERGRLGGTLLRVDFPLNGS